MKEKEQRMCEIGEASAQLLEQLYPTKESSLERKQGNAFEQISECLTLKMDHIKYDNLVVEFVILHVAGSYLSIR